jgi:serine/threonine-protein kinase
MRIADTLIAGKYRVSKKLGEGAMGSVWLAINQVTEREFAIKVLLPSAASEPAGLSRFFREARVCGTLRHPSILEIYDAGTAPELDGAPYLVMERLDGAPLDIVIRQRGALPPALAVDIVSHCARGLHLAHQKGVVHRDLKPANIFLHRPGTGALVPKVLDFGISKVVGGPEIALTQSSTVLGSPLYMSPEQMETKTLDARSDVHALGVVLWECLVGSPPFVSTAYNTLVVEIMRGPRPKLRDVLPNLSPTLSAIVERAFAMDPSERFATADALADALDAELALLGGSVLGSRTAATDLLSSLDLKSRPPPPKFTSTTQPLSVDPLPRPPSSADKIPVAPTSSAFLETLPAPEGAAEASSAAPALGEPLSSSGGTTDTRRPSRLVASLAAVGVLLAAAAAALAVSSREAPLPASTPLPEPLPSATARPRPPPSAPTVAATDDRSPPPSPALPTAAATTPPATAATTPPATEPQAPSRPVPPTASPAVPMPVVARPVTPPAPKPHPAASAAPSHPRIDESGL